MKDPIPRDHLRAGFWKQPLDRLTPREWEALCDGCGKCCLNKLEDPDTGEIAFTRDLLPPARRPYLPLRPI